MIRPHHQALLYSGKLRVHSASMLLKSVPAKRTLRVCHSDKQEYFLDEIDPLNIPPKLKKL